MELNKLHPTKLYRNAYGNWTAEDTYLMPNSLALRILTMKRYGGALVTTATAGRLQGSAFIYTPSEDFNERMADVDIRCTQAGVLKQHSEYAAYPDRVRAVMERAVAHYKPLVKADPMPRVG